MIAPARPGDPFAFFSRIAAGATTPGTSPLDDLLVRLLPGGVPDVPKPTPIGTVPNLVSTARLSAMLRQDYARPEPAAPSYPPIRGTGYRIPIIAPPETPTPPTADLLGLQPQQRAAPPGESPPAVTTPSAPTPEHDYPVQLPVPVLKVAPVHHSLGAHAARVVSAAKRAVGDLFEAPLGLSDETMGPLINQGPEDFQGARGATSLFRTFNQVLIQGGSQALDAAGRLALAPLVGGIAAVTQAAREAGMSETNARKLERDLNAIAVSASIVSGSALGGSPRVPWPRRVLAEADLRGVIDNAVRTLPREARAGVKAKLRDALKAGEDAGKEAAKGRQAGGSGLTRRSPLERDPLRSLEGGLVPGSRDPQTGALVMQPSSDRRLLLREAEKARPGFETSLHEIADSVPGSFVEGPRVKGDNPRLDQKVQRYHRDLERSGKTATGPDDGAHLIDDYLAGRIIVDNQDELDKIVKAVENRFEVIQNLDRMKEPIKSTGFTGLFYQVRLPNGMTAELQIQPKPFWEAAKEQRPSYELIRQLEGKEWSAAQKAWVAKERKRSQGLFKKAWDDWIASGGRDIRQAK